MSSEFTPARLKRTSKTKLSGWNIPWGHCSNHLNWCCNPKVVLAAPKMLAPHADLIHTPPWVTCQLAVCRGFDVECDGVSHLPSTPVWMKIVRPLHQLCMFSCYILWNKLHPISFWWLGCVTDILVNGSSYHWGHQGHILSSSCFYALPSHSEWPPAASMLCPLLSLHGHPSGSLVSVQALELKGVVHSSNSIHCQIQGINLHCPLAVCSVYVLKKTSHYPGAVNEKTNMVAWTES